MDLLCGGLLLAIGIKTMARYEIIWLEFNVLDHKKETFKDKIFSSLVGVL